MDDLRAPPPAPSLARQRPGRVRRLMPWLILALVLGAIVLGIRLLGHAAAPQGHAATPPQTVSVAPATLADMEASDTGLGTVTSLATVVVQSQISGVLQAVGFREGQLVHRGDFLAQIDPRPYQALLDQARGTLAHDQGLLRQAQTDARRYATLQRQDSIGRQQAEDQQFVVQQYEGSVAADQGAIQTQLVNLAFCHIVSPIDGRVGLRQVDAGNYVTPALTNGLVVVTQIDPISVIFTLPEDDLPPIQARLAAGVTLQVTAFDRSNTLQLATGTLETIDNQIDTTTGTFKLRALFANPTGALFANQFVNVKLVVSTVHGAVGVPNAAMQTGAPGSFVYLLQPDDTVAVHAVKTGLVDSTRTQIASGLSAGDRVVIDGADRLRDGAHVKVAGQPSDGAAPAATHAHHHRPAAP